MKNALSPWHGKFQIFFETNHKQFWQEAREEFQVNICMTFRTLSISFLVLMQSKILPIWRFSGKHS